MYYEPTTPPKKYTQEIFDDLVKNKTDPSYGDLSLVFEIFRDLTDIRNNIACMSQNDLARKSGIAQSSIARIESGRANPTLMQLVKLARGLDHKIKFEPAKFVPGDYESYKE